MVYQALYRTYRPRQFSEVIGQDHIVRTLLNSVRQDKVGHAYLFSGPRGTGKTTVARILARAINCEKPADGEPCDKCDRCKGSEEGLGVLEIDAASHGSVDDMRLLVAQVSQMPLSGGMMVYIIDEVHMLSKEAFNAFLKTLEEPPPHAVFVLATTEPGKLLPTIHSRCQHFAFRRVPLGLVTKHITWICEQEKVPAEESAIRLIARAGDGGVRDSISVLEQAIAYEPKGLTLQGVRDVLGIPDRLDIRSLAGHVISGDPGAASESFAGLIESGREPGAVLTGLLSHFRDLLFAVLEIEHSDLTLLPDEERDLVTAQAKRLSVKEIHGAITFLAKCEGEIRWEDEAALLLEASLLRLMARFGREARSAISPEEAAAETARSEAKQEADEAKEPTEPEVEMFPAAKKPKPQESARPQPTREVGGPGLTRGLTLKRKPEPEKPEEKPVAGTEATPSVPKDVDPFWRNALESVREASVTDYILLSGALPSPPPPEWPKHEGKSPKPLELTLRYPADHALIVKFINQPGVVTRILKRLEEVLERPIELRAVHERGKSGGVSVKEGSKQAGMLDGEGAIPATQDPGSPSLFPGAGRPAPSDPEIKQIHDLIVKDFPEYTIEKQ